jgi:hypothetical protein
MHPSLSPLPVHWWKPGDRTRVGLSKEHTMDELWQMERDFWLEGPDVFEERLAAECLMVLPGVGTLDRQQVIESLHNAPRWTDVEMHAQREAVVGNTVAVLAYEAIGRRESATPYRTACTSTYVLEHHRAWRMVQHQQTPAA